MMTFLALAHMVDATQVMGWGGMMTFLALAHMVDATQVMGWGGVGWGGVGLMTFLALATLTWHAWSMLRNRWWGGVGCNSIVDLALCSIAEISDTVLVRFGMFYLHSLKVEFFDF